jgi:two-component system phosphate regulon sensor histidine kinase PhoR
VKRRVRFGADHRLFSSYLFLIVAVVATLTLGVGSALRTHLTRSAEEGLRRELALALELHRALAPAATDSDLLADRVGALSGRRVSLIAADGRVTGDSRFTTEQLAQLENHGGRPEIREARAGRMGRARRRSRSTGAEELYLAAPAGDGQVVRLSIPLVEVERAVTRIQRGILGVGAGALIFAALFSWAFSRAFTRRLREVSLVARAMAGGDLSRRIFSDRDDELGALGAVLNSLAAELQRRLAQLEGERAETQAMIDTMSEGVLALAPDGTVRRANPAARRIFSLPPDPRGTPPQAVARRPAFLSFVNRALGGAPIPPTELQYDQHHLFATAQPLAAGGAVLVFLDVTELRRLEDVRRDFVANASHELKTPLTAIRGYSETLLDEELPAPLRRQFAETVRVNADRLQRIVDDLLDLSRIESGGWRVEPRPISVVEMAREVWEPFAERAAAAGVEFTTEAAGGAETVYADPSAMRQILINLCSNALRYTGRGGRIAVRARRDDGGACVEVADTGSGIPAASLPRIFERFYRVDAARTRAEGGTGLGLAIVRHLVERHGGRVEAQSELGRGTTVRFTLPAVPL